VTVPCLFLSKPGIPLWRHVAGLYLINA